MNLSKKALLALLSLGFVAIFSGCTTKTANDTTIPWSRPATWEGSVPGMGDLGSANERR